MRTRTNPRARRQPTKARRQADAALCRTERWTRYAGGAA